MLEWFFSASLAVAAVVLTYLAWPVDAGLALMLGAVIMGCAIALRPR